MLRADGQFPKFRVIGAGRRFPQLVARLREATDFVTLSGVASEPYSKQFAGTEIPFDNSALPELEPYRDADPERIKLKGRGHWDITDFLPDSLCMPYREPMVIFEDRLPEPWEYPKIKETPLQIAKIAKVWDTSDMIERYLAITGCVCLGASRMLPMIGRLETGVEEMPANSKLVVPVQNFVI